MKTAETKSASQQHKTAANSFFNQGQEQAFFSEQASDRSTFFPTNSPNLIQFKSINGRSPFFSASAPTTIQRKCTTCEAEEASRTGKESSVEPPTVQRAPAFESEGAVQAKIVPGAAAIAPPTATPQTQQGFDTKELEQQEAIAESPQIQMMPAFSSADDAGDGDDTNTEHPPVQFSLTIGQPGDAYEREADAIADQVVARPKTPLSSPSILQSRSDTIRPKHLQRKPSLQRQPDGSLTVAGDIGSRLQSTKGGGSPLDNSTRSGMESAVGADFSNVRIHTGKEAVQLSQDLGAQAFTHGSDIYFNKDNYNPASREGEYLLAHELTHTIQQDGLQRKLIQRAPMQPSPNEFILSDGTRVDRTTGNKQIQIPAISLPTFKDRHEQRFKVLALRRGERYTKQGEHWRESVRKPVMRHLNEMLPKARENGGYVAEGNIYFFKAESNSSQFYLFGKPDELEEPAMLPFWDKNGLAHSFEIDHIVEDQLVNKDDDPKMGGLSSADKASNFELLDSLANSSSGPQIANEINRRLKSAIALFLKEFPGEKPLTLEGLKYGYNVNFLSRVFDLKGTKGEPNNYWLHREIIQGQHLKKLRPLTGRELRLLNREDRPVIFTSGQGGERRFVEERKLPYKNWLPRVDLTGIELNDNPAQANPAGWLTVDVFSAKDVKAGEIIGSYDNMRWQLKSVPGVYGGAIDKGYLKENFLGARQSLRLPGLSPINLNQFDITNRGILAEGKVLPTIPIISKADVDIVIDGRDVRLRKLFDIGEIQIPRPFEISSASLEVFYGSRGIGASGDVDFAIQNVGRGRISASVSTRGRFELEGEFNFDSKKFDPALIAVKYSKEEGFEIKGKVGIKEGTIPGVKDALLEASYAKDTLLFAGLAHLSVPGIDAITLAGQVDDKGNFAFTADVNLKAMKGIKSGNVKVTITSKEGEEDIKLRVEGKASPDFPSVPNLNTDLSVLYDNGIFKVETTVNYKKGRFDGTIHVGVTNQPVDDKGNPQGEPNEKGEVVVFGFGELTVDIFKGNTGTIHVRLTPDKEVLIAGRIVLQNLSPFGDGVYYKKEIQPFPELEILLIGIPGMSVSAFIKGGVHFKFNWQPLMLKLLTVEFKETNINELENAQLDITGSVGSIATAEIYIAIDAGLDARVAIATLSGSLGGEAGLGVTAEAGGDIQATWDMEKGLQLKEIVAHLDVTPRAIFRLTGKISVDLDLWLTSVNLYYHEWTLAEKAIDMGGLTLKAQFPIRFDEKGDLITPTYENMSLEKPNFTGDAGRDILNKAINSDAEKELAAKKEEIRAKIKSDLRDPKNELTPTQYTGKMKKKYKDSPELQEFVIKAIEDESRLLEYEQFEKQKNIIRQVNIPLENKLNFVNLFKLYNRYVIDTDIEAFKTELIKIEEDKKLKAEQDKQAAEQAKQEQLTLENAQKQNASKPKSKNKKAATPKKTTASKT